MKRKNYLNNKDLLKEIHKSKGSYCSYIADGDDRFDIILPNISKINIRTIAEAKRNRANRLAKQAYEEIRDDAHPVVIISGGDIVNLLSSEAYMRNTRDLKEWLKTKFPV